MHYVAGAVGAGGSRGREPTPRECLNDMIVLNEQHLKRVLDSLRGVLSPLANASVLGDGRAIDSAGIGA